jgi:hypothetical protein
MQRLLFFFFCAIPSLPQMTFAAPMRALPVTELRSCLISTREDGVHRNAVTKPRLRRTREFYFRGMLLSLENLQKILQKGLRPDESKYQRLFFSKLSWGADIYARWPALNGMELPKKAIRVIFQIEPRRLGIAPGTPVDMLEVDTPLAPSDFTAVWVYSPQARAYLPLDLRR